MNYVYVALLGAGLCVIIALACVICFVYFNFFHLNSIKKFEDIKRLWQSGHSHAVWPTTSI